VPADLTAGSPAEGEVKIQATLVRLYRGQPIEEIGTSPIPGTATALTTAASILLQEGGAAVPILMDSFEGWSARGLPLDTQDESSFELTFKIWCLASIQVLAEATGSVGSQGPGNSNRCSDPRGNVHRKYS
jgi:hypothetical protein